MNYKVLIKVAVDALIQLLGLIVLNILIIAGGANFLSMEQFMYIGTIGAIIVAVIYVIMMIKELRNRDIVICLLTSILCYIICQGIMFMVSLTFPVSNSFAGEVNNAYGIIIIFSEGRYIFASYILKIFASAILIIKNTIKKKSMNVEELYYVE